MVQDVESIVILEVCSLADTLADAARAMRENRAWRRPGPDRLCLARAALEGVERQALGVAEGAVCGGPGVDPGGGAPGRARRQGGAWRRQRLARCRRVVAHRRRPDRVSVRCGEGRVSATGGLRSTCEWAHPD